MKFPRHALQHSYHRLRRRSPIMRYFSLTSVILVISWVLVLYWGERSYFKSHITACEWDTWERWESGAIPHRAVLVADPQLVDPHTYPGRPWPLDTLTEVYTDMYMARNFKLINRRLNPASVVFVGDLLDGGREWATRHAKPYQGEEKQKKQMVGGDNAQSFFYGEEGRWAKWGPEQWDKEFERFGRIFLSQDQLYPEPHADRINDTDESSRSRQVLTNLPGNHDVGFGAKVQLSVRERFESYFGKSNTLHVLGNHTFVFVDSPSYSAYDQWLSDGTVTSDEGRNETQFIWQPTQDFLDNIETTAESAIAAVLQPAAQGSRARANQLHKVIDAANELDGSSITTIAGRRALPDQGRLPVVLMTHVPLYRYTDADCGPLRENGNAISVSAGYQYQNILTPMITNNIVQKVSGAGEIRHVFSGDDHDYCELSHRFNLKSFEDGSGKESATMQVVKEITVKSFSWAMGVRLPGFLLVSLWNPIDELGHSMKSGHASIQTHLCLLPDQLGIFIAYGKMLGITILVVFVRAIIISIRFRPELEDDLDDTGSPTRSLLPRFQSKPNGQASKSLLGASFMTGRRKRSRNRASSISTSSSTNNNNMHLSVQRSFFSRTRSVSPAIGAPAAADVPLNDLSFDERPAQTAVPLIEQAGYYPPQFRWENPSESDEESRGGDDRQDSQAKWKRRRRVPTRLSRFFAEVFVTLAWVAVPCAFLYGVLIMYG